MFYIVCDGIEIQYAYTQELADYYASALKNAFVDSDVKIVYK